MMALTLHVVMNLTEGLVSMPVLKESKEPVWKYFNFELDESERPLIVLFVCRLQMAQNEPRRAKTAPDGFRQSQMAPEEPQIQEVEVKVPVGLVQELSSWSKLSPAALQFPRKPCVQQTHILGWKHHQMSVMPARLMRS